MNALVKYAVFLIISLLTSSMDAQESYSITVKVEKADSNEGKMLISIFSTETNFLTKSYKNAKSEISNNGCIVTFEDIPEGTYAVSIFHDENDNGKLDSNFMGIPKEDYGCSNNAKGFMGPPKWKDAKFQLKEDSSITITL